MRNKEKQSEENEHEHQERVTLKALELLLPAFFKKLDERGSLDLADAIPAHAYKGCGVHVLAIQPKDGTIHSICYGKEEVPLGFYEEENEAVFETFAEESLLAGYVPVQCFFSRWVAGSPRLFYVL